ncbi:MAG TPA: CHAP domain-containing protein [Stellaceae bacterium]|jgi:surface antigen|nr:CHAP domain-containing protein [Stellaceae bacterium]
MLSLPAAASESYGGNCVTYVREVTGIEISGNAGDWWDNAAGSYRRGHQPTPGAVLVFRPAGRMWAGHVAVVSRVVGAREILVNQANWPRGAVIEGAAVFDVSANNDWTMVRVAEERSQSWGRLNPTFGFIYPDQSEPRENPVAVATRESARFQLASDETEEVAEPTTRRHAQPSRAETEKPAPRKQRLEAKVEQKRHPLEAKTEHERRHGLAEAKATRHHELAEATVKHSRHHETAEAKAEQKRHHDVEEAKAGPTAHHHHAAIQTASRDEPKPAHTARHLAHAARHPQPHQDEDGQQIAEIGRGE